MAEEKKVSINVQGEHFKRQLISDINQTEIPIGMAYYIVKDIFNELEKTYYGTLNSEAPIEYTEASSVENRDE